MISFFSLSSTIRENKEEEDNTSFSSPMIRLLDHQGETDRKKKEEDIAYFLDITPVMIS